MRRVAPTRAAVIVDVPVSAPVAAFLLSAFAVAVVVVAVAAAAAAVNVGVVAVAAVEAGAEWPGRVGTASGSTCQRQPSDPEVTIEQRSLNIPLVTVAGIKHNTLLLIRCWIIENVKTNAPENWPLQLACTAVACVLNLSLRLF